MKLTPDELSGLTGPQVLEFVDAQVRAERAACAAIAETEAQRLEKHGLTHSAEIAQRIAARIGARGIQ